MGVSRGGQEGALAPLGRAKYVVCFFPPPPPQKNLPPPGKNVITGNPYFIKLSFWTINLNLRSLLQPRIHDNWIVITDFYCSKIIFGYPIEFLRTKVGLVPLGYTYRNPFSSFA